MTRLTNEQMSDKSIGEIKIYVGEHPSEGARASGILAKASAECIEEYFAYQAQKIMKLGTPQSLQEE